MDAHTLRNLDTPEPLTSGDVARLCHVTRTTVQSWARRGALPHYRTPGGQLRFRALDVAALVAEQFTPAGAPAYDHTEG